MNLPRSSRPYLQTEALQLYDLARRGGNYGLAGDRAAGTVIRS